MERNVLGIKLSDRICNAIIRFKVSIANDIEAAAAIHSWQVIKFEIKPLWDHKSKRGEVLHI